MGKRKFIGVIDIGAGIGAKTGIFDLKGNCIQKGMLPVSSYGRSAEVMADRLFNHCKRLLDTVALSCDDLMAVGVDMPGVIYNGQVYICSNLPFLAGIDIRMIFEREFNVPVIIINDGESGGLMEWRVRKKELLYWVVGGGWGGTWIDPDGRVTGKKECCENMDMDFFTVNEPGYASGVSESILDEIFQEYGLSLKRFCHYFIKLGRAIPWQLMDINTGVSYIRAESLVSNIGLYCLFHTVMETASKKRADKMQADLVPDKAGSEIAKLSLSGEDEALKTMKLFGRIFGEVAVLVTARAKSCGAPDNIPVYLSGGLANSFDIFIGDMKRPFTRNGDHSVIEPSYFLDKEMNTNIMGTFYITRETVSHN
jgi:hypothetical protein